MFANDLHYMNIFHEEFSSLNGIIHFHLTTIVPTLSVLRSPGYNKLRKKFLDSHRILKDGREVYIL